MHVGVVVNNFNLGYQGSQVGIWSFIQLLGFQGHSKVKGLKHSSWCLNI